MVGGVFEGTGQGSISVEGFACLGDGRKIELFNFQEGYSENCNIEQHVSFQDFETIADNAVSSDTVAVVTTGGTYSNSDFGFGSSSRGSSMVIFNTTNDVTITGSPSGDVPFVATLIAPYATVTMDASSQGSFGTIVAKNLIGGDGIQVYGDSYQSEIACPYL